MSNLRKQVQQIRQQLALATAETIANVKGIRADMKAMRSTMSSMQENISSMDERFGALQDALVAQGSSQQSALDRLFDLVVEEQSELRAELHGIEERVRRLEDNQDPAA